jgi:DNA-directed RNA polymerase I, II, and III subunit RPABC2
MSDEEVDYEEDLEEEEDDLEEEEEEYDDQDDDFVEPLQVEENEDIPMNEYKTKFSNEMRSEYIQKCHPEEIHKSFDEIYKLSHVTRDKNGNIIDDKHTTYPVLSKYEKTRVIGLRVSQLNKGAHPFITLKNKILDNSLIAEKELQEKALPFIIMRPIPNADSEYWKVSDLEYI